LGKTLAQGRSVVYKICRRQKAFSPFSLQAPQRKKCNFWGAFCRSISKKWVQIAYDEKYSYYLYHPFIKIASIICNNFTKTFSIAVQPLPQPFKFQFTELFKTTHNPIVIPSQFSNWRGNLFGNLRF